jgi:hypothetical protein
MNEIVPTTPTTPADLMRHALDNNVDIAKLEKLMEMQLVWEQSQSAKAFNRAFAAFKAEGLKLVKSREVAQGPLKGTAYAELHSILNTVTPALSRHGLSLSWKLTKDALDWIEVTCLLKHADGHCEVVSMGSPPDADRGTSKARNTIQERASAVSYLERYTAKAILGLSEQGDDDDGSGALDDLLARAREAAMGGTKSYLEFWQNITGKDRADLKSDHPDLKEIAAKADAATKVAK